MSEKKRIFEQGPIRPPSEAGSLLIRLSRNCPWNKCLFCPVYKFDKFSRRSAEEIKEDVDSIAGAIDDIKKLSVNRGFGGAVNREILEKIYHSNPDLLGVASWLYYGEKSVFLQDADNMVYNGEKLSDIISYIHERLPGIERMTTYARAKSLVKRSSGELEMLKNAGLTRIHVGLESGSDKVLSYMKKGVTAAEHVEAGQKVKEAGLTLSEYVMPGLGGKENWHEHATETAMVLNKINPDYIRVRTLAVHPMSPLMQEWQSGAFNVQSDEEILREQKLFLESLEGINSEYYSDHILNLLEEIQGVFPEDKQKMISVIDNYFSLSEKERELFLLGRRSGLLRHIRDLEDHYLRDRVEELLAQIRAKGMTVDEFINEIRTRYL